MSDIQIIQLIELMIKTKKGILKQNYRELNLI